MTKSTAKSLLNATVIISALGYFVDIYDLVLFSIVRVQSLKDLGVTDAELLPVGVRLLNMQMIGMLLGGLVWGVLGDKRGRVSVLFGSIALYSLANIANAFVSSTDVYGWLRLIAGIGLAGELGAAITLVSESLPKETRGYGTSLVAGIGVSGAMLAAVMGQSVGWRAAYVVGGVMGLALLALRVRMLESGMYRELQTQTVRRGDFALLFQSPARLLRYVACIVLGLPIWYVIGLLVTFSPEICAELGVTGPVSAGTGILWCYFGLVFGDIGSGFLSQLLQSRKKVVFAFITATLALVLVFVSARGVSPTTVYLLCFALGCAVGYWALFVTIAAEQFGTNLRATVTTTTPNFVRGSVVLVTIMFQTMKADLGLARSALYVGLGCIAAAYAALWRLQESFGRDLDFVEADGDLTSVDAGA
jgi:MFS family permease